MRVVVLMSTYNGEKYIREQIVSILEQEGDFQLDLLVRDDGSNDGTIEILKKYERRGRLKWYTGRNLKPAHSFLDLLKHCGEYDYYTFVDQDDYWMSDKIKKGIKALKGVDSPALYFSNAELVDRELNSLGRNVYVNTPRTDFYTVSCAGGILGCTMVFNHQLAELVQNKEFPKRVPMHDFYITLLCLAVGGKVIYDDQPSMKYRQHGNNVVGVAYGFMNTIRNRLKAITHKEKVSIADQAQEILHLYGDCISSDYSDWLNRVASYRGSITKRISLSCSRKTKYINRNMGLRLRLSILFGNR